MQRPQIDFNVLLTEDDRSKLIQLAALDGISKGAALRYLIRIAYAHRCGGSPQCADGQRCMCPHLLGPMPTPTEAPAPRTN